MVKNPAAKQETIKQQQRSLLLQAAHPLVDRRPLTEAPGICVLLTRRHGR